MKVFQSIISGFCQSLKSWKGVLMIWLFLLILVSAVTFPLKASLNTSFGNSMITGKIAGGFNPEIFSDLGNTLKSIFSFFRAGLVFIIFLGFVLGVFFTAGLFSGLSKRQKRFSASEFFRNGAHNFWSFFVISLIVIFLTLCIAIVFSAISYFVVQSVEGAGEKISFLIGASGAVIIILIIPVFLLVADYSRAWKTINEDISGIRALGFGFSQTFRKFWSSYIVMLIMILLQLVPVFAAFEILPSWDPSSTVGAILLFIVAQVFVFTRVLFKAWRFASVTAMMEEDIERTVHYQGI